MKAKILRSPSAISNHVILAEIEKYGTIVEGGVLADHHLLVVGAEDAGSDLVRQALDNHRGIIVLNASESAKNALRDAGVGFSTDGECLAYFVQKQSASHIRVLELPIDGLNIKKGGSGGGGQASSTDLAAPGILATAPDHPESVNRFTTNLLESLKATSLATSLDAAAPGEIPPGVIYLRVQFTVHGSVTNDGQVSAIDVNYDVYGFLNNPTTGNHFQILFLETSALANPGKQKSYSTYTKGWVQHELEYTAELVQTPPGLFGIFGHTPQNTAKQTTVTTSAGFDVGYGSASFKFSRDKTETISDWEIIDQSTGLSGHWTYAQMLPFPGMGDIDCCASSNGCPFGFWDTAEDYGTLSRYTLTANTMVEWRTTSVTSSLVNISTSAWVKLGYYHSYGIGWNCYYNYVGASKVLQIDFSKISGQ